MWLKKHIFDATKPVFKNYGIVYHKIMSEWSLIVGKELQNKVTPIDVKFPKNKTTDATLLLEVENPSYGLEVQMMTFIILDKIAIYFGYKVVKKIKIIPSNGKLKCKIPDAKADYPKNKSLGLDKLQDVINAINQNEDEEIRKTLMRIAKQL
jgi:hypothetical protein